MQPPTMSSPLQELGLHAKNTQDAWNERAVFDALLQRLAVMWGSQQHLKHVKEVFSKYKNTKKQFVRLAQVLATRHVMLKKKDIRAWEKTGSKGLTEHFIIKEESETPQKYAAPALNNLPQTTYIAMSGKQTPILSEELKSMFYGRGPALNGLPKLGPAYALPVLGSTIAGAWEQNADIHVKPLTPRSYKHIEVRENDTGSNTTYYEMGTFFEIHAGDAEDVHISRPLACGYIQERYKFDPKGVFKLNEFEYGGDPDFVALAELHFFHADYMDALSERGAQRLSEEDIHTLNQVLQYSKEYPVSKQGDTLQAWIQLGEDTQTPVRKQFKHFCLANKIIDGAFIHSSPQKHWSYAQTFHKAIVLAAKNPTTAYNEATFSAIVKRLQTLIERIKNYIVKKEHDAAITEASDKDMQKQQAMNDVLALFERDIFPSVLDIQVIEQRYPLLYDGIHKTLGLGSGEATSLLTNLKDCLLALNKNEPLLAHKMPDNRILYIQPTLSNIPAQTTTASRPQTQPTREYWLTPEILKQLDIHIGGLKKRLGITEAGLSSYHSNFYTYQRGKEEQRHDRLNKMNALMAIVKLYEKDLLMVNDKSELTMKQGQSLTLSLYNDQYSPITPTLDCDAFNALLNNAKQAPHDSFSFRKNTATAALISMVTDMLVSQQQTRKTSSRQQGF